MTGSLVQLGTAGVWELQGLLWTLKSSGPGTRHPWTAVGGACFLIPLLLAEVAEEALTREAMPWTASLTIARRANPTRLLQRALWEQLGLVSHGIQT